MEYRTCPIRPDWPAKCVEAGFHYHTSEAFPEWDFAQQPYWMEGHYFSLTESEANTLAKAAYDLHELAMEAAEYIVTDADRLKAFIHAAGLPEEAAKLIVHSWMSAPPSIYGRFDLAWNPERGTPQLLEYNADTPTGMCEQMAQQMWGDDVFPGEDQFAALDDALMNTFMRQSETLKSLHIAVSSFDEGGEDAANALYYGDRAREAGLRVTTTILEFISFDERTKRWLDHEGTPIDSLYHVYPMEYMLGESAGPNMWMYPDAVNWLEPVWKVLLSNKYILPIMHQLNPKNPLILPAYLDGPHDLTDYVTKPLRGREGENVTVFENNQQIAVTRGTVGHDNVVYQKKADFATFGEQGEHHPEFGVWLVDGQPAALGIREPSPGRTVLSYWSRFIPHIVK